MATDAFLARDLALLSRIILGTEPVYKEIGPRVLDCVHRLSNAVAMFCSYLTLPGHGWAEFCERTFSDIPATLGYGSSPQRLGAMTDRPSTLRADDQNLDYALAVGLIRARKQASDTKLPIVPQAVALLAMTSSGIDLPAGYDHLLESLKNRVHSARTHAMRTVNTLLIELYWSLGRDILARQEQQGWGSGVLNRLTTDLRLAFPDM